MAKLYACMIAYNEEALIEPCVASLVGKCDDIIVVDGRMDEFPGDSVVSTDRTAEICRDYGAIVIQRDTVWPDEYAARNAYLQGEVGDWYFIIDADEVLLTPLPHPDELPGTGYRVRDRMMGTNGDVWPLRLVKHTTPTIEYRYTHYWIYRDEERMLPRDYPRLPSVWLLHRQPLRDAMRRRQKLVKRTKTHHREELRIIEYGIEHDLQSEWYKTRSQVLG